MSDTLVISGGSSGIGLATARAFLEAGWRVINLSRRPIGLDGARHLEVDLADPSAMQRLRDSLQRMLADQARIALVHNAGMLRKDAIDNLAAEDLNRVLQVNVTAAVTLNQIVLPKMAAGSSITYVGSTLSEKAVAGAASYAISKHAVVGLMRATCQDLAGRGIHTACVCPGFTDTPMLRAHVGHSDEILRAIAGNVTVGRLIKPEEIAELIAYVADHPVVNGAVLHANLGQVEH